MLMRCPTFELKKDMLTYELPQIYVDQTGHVPGRFKLRRATSCQPWIKTCY
jgi:hypothetical protein